MPNVMSHESTVRFSYRTNLQRSAGHRGTASAAGAGRGNLHNGIHAESGDDRFSRDSCELHMHRQLSDERRMPERIPSGLGRLACFCLRYGWDRQNDLCLPESLPVSIRMEIHVRQPAGFLHPRLDRRVPMRKRSAFVLAIDGRIGYKSPTDPGYVSIHL